MSTTTTRTLKRRRGTTTVETSSTNATSSRRSNRSVESVLYEEEVASSVRRNPLSTRRTNRNAENIAVIDDSNCIDLTCDVDDHIIVDLTTSMNETPPVTFNYRQSFCVGPSNRRRRRTDTSVTTSSSATRPLNVCIVDDCSNCHSHQCCCHKSDSEDDLPEVDFGQLSGQQCQSIESTENIRVISCPICFDSDQEITQSNRQLMSTTCGHIFCSDCIYESIQKNRCCPKCRKRLTNRQIHAIFL